MPTSTHNFKRILLDNSHISDDSAMLSMNLMISSEAHILTKEEGKCNYIHFNTEIKIMFNYVYSNYLVPKHPNVIMSYGLASFYQLFLLPSLICKLCELFHSDVSYKPDKFGFF